MKTGRHAYMACFPDPDLLWAFADGAFPDRLEKRIRFPHVTVRFEPDEVPDALIGEKARVLVTGYGNDGTNEGLLVEIASGNPDLQALLDTIQRPHITLSVSRQGKAVDTARLDFGPAEPFEMEAVFGVWTGSRLILSGEDLPPEAT